MASSEQHRRVVITGVGLHTPMGDSLDDIEARYRRGASAVRYRPDSQGNGARAAAFLDGDAAQGFPGALAKMTDRSTLIALRASDAVMGDAALRRGEYDATRIGTFLGFGFPTETNFAASGELLRTDHMSPMTLFKMLPNAAAGHVSMRHGLKGECATHLLACCAAAAALAHAMRSIRHGYLDMAIAGGVDTPLAESSFRAWEALQLLASADPENPAAACRPFSADRRGFVLGEGAVLYLLEDEAHARARGARIYATLAGCGLSASAGNATLPSASGVEAAMRGALEDAGLGADAIGYVNAEGSATARGDVIETQALHATFGARARAVPVSSTKPFHGHLLGASAAMDMLAALVALDRGVIAPTLNLDAPDPECDLDYVPNAARTDVRIDAAMVNTFGFGGCNASVVLTH